MDQEEIKFLLDLANEADIQKDYKTADTIEKMVREAAPRTQSLLNRIVNPINKRLKRLQKVRATPELSEAEALITLQNRKKLPGQEMRVRSIGEGWTAWFKSTFQQVEAASKTFPKDFEKYKTQVEKEIENALAEWKAANPSASVAELKLKTKELTETIGRKAASNSENPVVRLYRAQKQTVRMAVDTIRKEAGKAGSKLTTDEIMAKMASDRRFSGILSRNSDYTQSFVKGVIEGTPPTIKEWAVSFGPIKRLMGPGTAGLIGAGVGALLVGGAWAINEAFEPKPSPVPTPEKAVVDYTEMGQERTLAGQYDTPETELQAYLDRKQKVGAYKPGVTTKRELYDMALIDKGGWNNKAAKHFANNLIAYVGKNKGFGVKGRQDEETTKAQP